MATTTGLGIIKSALRGIQSYQSGETIAQFDQTDCLEALNFMLDSWSLDKIYIYGSQTNVFTWVSGQSQYKIGNPLMSDLGEPSFTGTLTSGSPTISSVTNIPSDLKVGATLSDVAACITSGTTVSSIGSTTITMSANASATPNGTDSISYTIPGDFVMPRPNRITGAFTRFSQLDYSIDIYATQEEYNSILYKAQPGPWPVIGWYNPVYPYGLLNVYQTPNSSSSVYIFSDTILSNVQLTDTFQLPMGYALALKWNLAVQLWPEYVRADEPPAMILKLAADSLDRVKALNEKPAEISYYDGILTSSPRGDYGWILHGGYGR